MAPRDRRFACAACELQDQAIETSQLPLTFLRVNDEVVEGGDDSESLQDQGATEMDGSEAKKKATLMGLPVGT